VYFYFFPSRNADLLKKQHGKSRRISTNF